MRWIFKVNVAKGKNQYILCNFHQVAINTFRQTKDETNSGWIVPSFCKFSALTSFSPY
jgi:hypothetical protein